MSQESEARDIVTQWMGMFDPPPQIDFQQYELLQAAIASALRHPAPVSQADDAKRITEAVLSALKAGGDHLAIYDAVKGAIGAAQEVPERGALTQLAAECHRAKWQFDLSEDYKPNAKAARAMILKAFDELHRIGDIALKLRTPSVPSADRCARCGCETKGEVAWVNGAEWCHPCADTVALPSTHHSSEAK